MQNTQVEVALFLEKELEFYHNMLTQNGLNNVFTITTHDIYLSNQNLDGLSENEIKNACIRLRSCTKNGEQDKIFKIQNNLCKNLNLEEVPAENLPEFIEFMEQNGFSLVFDTIKEDYHYAKEGMTCRVQLQQIKDIGLVVYYDNSEYYSLPFEEQRKVLIDELNSFGFSFDYGVQDLNKLETLYYGEERFSINILGNGYVNQK